MEEKSFIGPALRNEIIGLLVSKRCLNTLKHCLNKCYCNDLSEYFNK